jgi:hypothetical protein
MTRWISVRTAILNPKNPLSMNLVIWVTGRTVGGIALDMIASTRHTTVMSIIAISAAGCWRFVTISDIRHPLFMTFINGHEGDP